MRSFFIIAALVGTYATANAAEHYTPVGAPPICEVDAQGITHVFYVHAQHPSFKCTHSGSTCACTLQHPTHHKGGCKQLESKAAGKILDTGGDCTDSGKNTAAPTAAPTAAVWAGSDLAADVALMTDGDTINLAAGTFAWASEVTCSGKTITLAGAGKGATTLDAGGARRFFTLNSGCTLVLRALSLRSGKASGGWPANAGGAIFANSGSTLSARDVEFKDNSASYGGVAYVNGGPASFTSCAFTSNIASIRGAVLAVHSGGTATFASTLPANSFSGNPAFNNYGNCYKSSSSTITGSCD